MISRCEDLQRRLTLEGAPSLADDQAAQLHLETCEECFAILEGLHELDTALGSLPLLEPPRGWVDQLQEKVSQEPLETLGGKPSRWWQTARNRLEPLGRPAVRRRIAAVVVVGLATALLVPGLLQTSRREISSSSPSEDQIQGQIQSPAAQQKESSQSRSSSVSSEEAARLNGVEFADLVGHLEDREAAQSQPQSQSQAPLASLAPEPSELDPAPGVDSDIADFYTSYRKVPREVDAKKNEDQHLVRPGETQEERAGTPGKSQALPKPRQRPSATPPPPPPPPVGKRLEPAAPSPRPPLSEADVLAGRQDSDGSQLYYGNFDYIPQDLTPSGDSTSRTGREVGDGPWSSDVIAVSEAQAKLSESVFSGSVNFYPEEQAENRHEGQDIGEINIEPAEATAELDASSSPADKKDGNKKAFQSGYNEGKDIATGKLFLAERQQTQNLPFRDATGYWRNTYVPGDPMLRLLSSRLLGSGVNAEQRASLVQLHEAVQRPVQPFDPPRGAALALALSADQRTVSGKTRVLLQVGLQATNRRAGHRPPLDIALVLDLTKELPEDAETAIRALTQALCSARRSGDRFRLIVAGRPGGVLVDPESFRFGPLQVALDQLFGVGGSTAPTLDLPSALRAGLEVLQSEDQPDSQLGSSAILLATPRTFGNIFPEIETIAHGAAVASVPLSPIGIGDYVDGAELDRLAIAGQGNRRWLTRASSAQDLIDRELASASRAVARAVRLSIRLAPGVRLVDVVGSQSLDHRAAQRVRDAEQSVDQKIARSLGIAADRGEDEEGIQIVIPAFLAGDAHVILLDLVVPGPGAVADVRLRFKDLVQSRNGVSSAHLELPSGTDERGPLEHNVLHNLLVLRLVETFDRAGKAVAVNQINPARQLLEEHLSRLRGLEKLLPSLGDNREMAADRTLLQGYLEILSSEEISPETLKRLSDSLRYAARLKVLPAPEKIEP
ncbi:MAG: hypothetical protein K0U98_11270 [Deltaproteobacteria bacterium]|nr:hypothetical protein [Deltaproteobacteria bacterium]